MIDNKENTFHSYKFFLTLLPFFLFIYFILNLSGDCDSFFFEIETINVKISYFILSITIIGIIFKGYRFNWFYGWISFAIFFSIPHIIPYDSTYMPNKAISNLQFVLYQFSHDKEIFDLSICIVLIEFALLVTFFIFLNYLVIRKFKVNKTKLFLIIFSFFFSFHVITLKTFIHYDVYRLIGRLHVPLMFKISVLFTSIISIVFLRFFLKSKTPIVKILLIFTFLILIFLFIFLLFIYMNNDFLLWKLHHSNIIDLQSINKAFEQNASIKLDFIIIYFDSFWIRPLVLLNLLIISIIISMGIWIIVKRLLFPSKKEL